MSKKQVTVKRAVEAWHWIANNPHHIVGTEYNSKGDVTHIFFKNYFDTMRVPTKLLKEFWSGVKTNTRKFDTRMYALKPNARHSVEAS